jgi:hypothetical protein
MDSKRYSKVGYVNKIVDWFCERGWFELSQGDNQGAFCVALLASPDLKMVAKISQPECDGLVDLYPDFAKWVCTQNNPHFPKIYSARSLRYYDLFLTIMERLDHVNLSKIYEFANGNCPVLDEVDYQAYKLTQCARHKDFSEIMGYGVGTLTKAVIKFVDTFGNPTDLHLGNVMRRGNTLVITDPLTFRGRSDPLPVYSVSYTTKRTCNCPICVEYRKVENV